MCSSAVVRSGAEGALLWLVGGGGGGGAGNSREETGEAGAGSRAAGEAATSAARCAASRAVDFDLRLASDRARPNRIEDDRLALGVCSSCSCSMPAILL
eukprot:1855961-Rhodomonas_salina.1